LLLRGLHLCKHLRVVRPLYGHAIQTHCGWSRGEIHSTKLRSTRSWRSRISTHEAALLLAKLLHGLLRGLLPAHHAALLRQRATHTRGHLTQH
jgi:hypothetical protein